MRSEKVAKFADQVRRATANGQIINVDALIPPVISSVIEYELKAYKRPSIKDSDLCQPMAGKSSFPRIRALRRPLRHLPITNKKGENRTAMVKR